MNKTFKLKWNHFSQSWTVCSELTKTKGKSRYYLAMSILATSVLSTTEAIAAECGLKEGKSYDISTACYINGNENGGPKKIVSSIGWSTYVWARDGGRITVIDEGLDLELISTSQRDYFNSAGFNAQSNSIITGKNLRVNLKARPNKNVTMQGFVAFGNSTIIAKEINADITYQNDLETSRGVKENYAIQVGTSIKGEDAIANGQSKVMVGNANINITNTPATSNSLSLAPYQLTGIRVIRNENKVGSTPIFESTGKIVINAYDSSNDASGDYINGLFVSGPSAKAILNDSEIIIGKSGQHSSALKLGKTKKYGTGAGVVESKGTMRLDTTAESKAATVRLVGNDSALIANFDSSNNEIKSANTAILFGGSDYDSIGAGENQKVLLNNAVIRTTAVGSSLIHVNANTKGEFAVSGDKTDVTAAKNGWLINVGNGSILKVSGSEGRMTGLVNKKDTAKLNISLSNGFNWILSEHSDGVKQASFNELSLSSNSAISAAKNGTADFILKGDVISYGGNITTVDGKAGDVLTIDGNYEGNNASLYMDTIWNALGDKEGTNSASDIFKITGSATGSTIVSPVGYGGENNIIEGNVKQLNQVINSIPVIEVGKPGERVFSGKAQTRGAMDVQLAKRTENGKDLYYWTMKAKPQDVVPKAIPIYNPAVSAYVQMPSINMEQGYTILRTLHERQSESQALVSGSCSEKVKNQTWGRVFSNSLDLEGKERFGFNTEIYGFQLGHNLGIKQIGKGAAHSLTGLYIAYSQANTSFTDLYRAENAEISIDKFTGKGKSKLFSLGITNTHYTTNRSYLDFVGQISYLKNSYKTRDSYLQPKQNGYGLVLSVESGKPYILHSSTDIRWVIEPQAQLTYQTIKLNKFYDGIRTVRQLRENGLRGRIGTRFAYNNDIKSYSSNTFYIIANLWSDFSKKRNIKVHQDEVVSEKYSRFWGEIGLGTKIPVAKQTYLYADARYEFQINNLKREGYRSTIGLKYTWK